MNKKLITLALGAAFAGSLSMANAVELYGNVEASINSSDIDNGGPDDVHMDGGTNGVNGNTGDAPGGATNTSYFGLRVEEDLGNGLKAMGQVEFGFDITDTGGGVTVADRDQWIGLGGDFGTVQLGTVTTSYKAHGASIDPFDSTALQASIHGANSALNHDDYAGTDGQGRAENTIKYTSNAYNGVTVALHYTVGAQNEGAATDDDGAWGIGAEYENGNIFAFVDYIDGGFSGDAEAWQIGGKYSTEQFSVFAAWENDNGLISALTNTGGGLVAANANNNVDAADVWTIGGTFHMGATDISIAYSNTHDSETGGVSNNDEYDVIRVGAIHNLSERTRAYAGYSQTEADTNPNQLQFWTVGVGHSF